MCQIVFYKNTDSNKRFSKTDIITMLELLVDSIVAMSGGQRKHFFGHQWCSTSRLHVPS